MLKLHCNLLLVCPLHLLDCSGNLQPVTWKQIMSLESEFWAVTMKWKPQVSFWCFVPHPENSSFVSRRPFGCLWNSLGPALLEIWEERVCVAYWKETNDLRSTLGQAEGFHEPCTPRLPAQSERSLAETGKASMWKQGFWASEGCDG